MRKYVSDPCKYLSPTGDCRHPELDSDKHACVAIKMNNECPETGG